MKKIIILLLFICLTILLTYPGIARITTHLIGDGGDTLEYFSYIPIIKDNIYHSRWALAESQMFRYPFGIEPQLSDARLFVMLTGFFGLFMNHVVVYNSTLLIGLTLNAYISYLLYRRLTGNDLLGVVGGIINGFSFWTLVNSHGSMSVAFVFGFPLVGIVAYDIFKKGLSPSHYYQMAAAFYILALSSVVQLQQGIVVGLITTVTLGLFYPRSLIKVMYSMKNHYMHIVISIGLFINIIFFTFVGHFMKMFRGQVDIGTKLFAGSEFTNIFAQLIPPYPAYKSIAFVALEKAGVLYGSDSSWWQSTFYIGVVVVALVVFTGYWGRSTRLVRFFFTNTIISFFITQLIYIKNDVLLPKLPAWIAYPINYLFYHFDYFTISFWVFAAGTIVLGMQKKRLHWFVTICIAAILIVERLTFQYPTVNVAWYSGEQYGSIVSGLPGKAVLDLPLDVYSKYNLLPFSYQKPIMGGMVHWYGDAGFRREALESPEIARFSCKNQSWQDVAAFIVHPFSLQYAHRLNGVMKLRLSDYDVRTVVIHREYIRDERCENMREQLVSLFSDLTLAEAPIDSRVYQEIQRATEEGASFFQRVHADQNVFVYQLTEVDLENSKKAQ